MSWYPLFNVTSSPLRSARIGELTKSEIPGKQSIAGSLSRNASEISLGQSAGLSANSPLDERQATNLKSFSIRLRNAIGRSGERTSCPSLLRTTSTTNLPRAKYLCVPARWVNKCVALLVIDTSPLGRINCGFLPSTALLGWSACSGRAPFAACSACE